MDTPTRTLPAIVLVPGHWLGAWAWDTVATELRGRGHHVVALPLPGLDPDEPDRAAATVARQAEALGSAVDDAAVQGSSVVLVAHSGAGFPTSVLLDRDPTAIRRVVYVDSGPASDASAFDASVPPEVAEVPRPPFAELAAGGASLEGLSDNDARRDVPSTIIACSFSSEAVRQMAREGHPMMAEAAALRDLEFVDLPTGRWPMWSRPPPPRPRRSDCARGRALTQRATDRGSVAVPHADALSTQRGTGYVRGPVYSEEHEDALTLSLRRCCS